MRTAQKFSNRKLKDQLADAQKRIRQLVNDETDKSSALLIELAKQKDIITSLKADRNSLNLWTQANCTCGGGGPGEGCLACDVYHAAGLKGMGE